MTLRWFRLSPVVALVVGFFWPANLPHARGSEILNASAITQTTLPSGLRVVVKEAFDLNLVVLSVWVRAGSSDETEENNGVSHFLEHLMFSGTKKRGPLEFQREVEAMGGVANALSMQDATQYYVIVPKEHF
ncbi:MAG: insulinase family protein, partial [Armatimonadota bacterium]|nr:insulinase family protein [Armatimonadota bacterium]